MNSIEEPAVQDQPMENAEDELTDEDIEELLNFSSSSSEDDDDDDDDNEPLQRKEFESMPPLAPYEPSSVSELDPADSDQENDARITGRFVKETMAFVDIVSNKSDLTDKSVEALSYVKRQKKRNKAVKKEIRELVKAQLKKKSEESSAGPRRAIRSTQRK